MSKSELVNHAPIAGTKPPANPPVLPKTNSSPPAKAAANRSNETVVTKGGPLARRILEVFKAVKSVDKNKTIKAGSEVYKTITHDDVSEVLHDAVADAGILCWPTMKKCTITEFQKKNRFNEMQTWYRADVEAEVVFENADDPADKRVSQSFAYALDTSDKAVGKAYSLSLKMIYVKVFMLASRDNEEDRNFEKEPERSPGNQNTQRQVREPQGARSGPTPPQAAKPGPKPQTAGPRPNGPTPAKPQPAAQQGATNGPKPPAPQTRPQSGNAQPRPAVNAQQGPKPAGNPPQNRQVSAPKPPPAAQPPAPPKPVEKPRPPGAPNEAQVKRLFAIARAAGWSNQDVKRVLRDGYLHAEPSTLLLDQTDYNELCDNMPGLHPAAFINLKRGGKADVPDDRIKLEDAPPPDQFPPDDQIPEDALMPYEGPDQSQHFQEG